MTFKVGAVIGFGLGYYLGARAGRERYEQLNRWLRKARQTGLAQTAADKVKAIGDLGVERARDLVHHNGDESYSPSR